MPEGGAPPLGRRARLRRALTRLRRPAALGLLGVGVLAALDLLDPSPRVASIGGVVGRILTLLAAGWTLGTLGDLYLAQRLSGLQLDVADNLEARRVATRLGLLRRIWAVAVVTLTLAAALTAIPWARQIGLSIFASAGIAGIVMGIAARPVLSNLIAGLQVAFTQPVRLDDAVVVEGEWGWIEEIGLFHVVVRIWDRRRLIIPLTWFIEKPFQNWTHTSASIIGTVFWALDYRAPIPAMRAKLDELVRSTTLWDGEVCVLQVTDADARTIQVRALASARTSPQAWDLRCYLREQMLTWLQAEAPEALPTYQAEATLIRAHAADAPPPPEADTGLPRDTSLSSDPAS